MLFQQVMRLRNIFNNSLGFFGTLAYASEVKVQSDKAGIPDDAVSTVIPDAVIYIPFAELVDIDKEIERLNKEKDKLQGEIQDVTECLTMRGLHQKLHRQRLTKKRQSLRSILYA